MERNKCPWKLVGGNPPLYWCEKCGCIVTESNDDLEIPLEVEQTLYCPDRGLVP